jgi:hypothetical protein
VAAAAAVAAAKKWEPEACPRVETDGCLARAERTERRRVMQTRARGQMRLRVEQWCVPL